MNKELFYYLIGVICFKILMDIIYIIFITKLFSYEGFILDINLNKYIISFLFLIFTSINVFLHKKNVIFPVLLISFLLLIVPSCTLYSLTNINTAFFLYLIIFYNLFIFLIFEKKVKIKFISFPKSFIIILAIVIVLLVLIHYIKIVGIYNLNFNLSKVYELRRSEVGILSNSGIFGYLNSWTSKIFNIFLIAFFLYKRNYILTLFFVFIQVLLFAYSGHKEVLFSLILLFSLYFFEKFKKPSIIIVYGFIVGIIVLLIYYFATKDLMLPSILIRRVFFIPSYLNFIYMEYFSKHDFIYWSNGILKYFIPYSYNVQPVFLIGTYLGHPQEAANTGLFGSGYMQFGVIGIMIYILILAITVNIIQQFNKIPEWLVNSIILMPFLTAIISSDLPTTFLTHGFLIAIILLYIINGSKIFLCKGKQ